MTLWINRWATKPGTRENSAETVLSHPGEVGASRTMLNKSDESRYPCFIPDLRRKAFSLSPLCIM